MARIPYISREVEIPPGVTLEVEGKVVKVKGPLGEVAKDFSHALNIQIRKEGDRVILEAFLADKKTFASINTIASKIQGMITGVLKGYRYKMKIVYAHFPMSVKVDKSRGVLTIDNFLGKRDTIVVPIIPGVTVRVQEDDVIVEGVDKEAVAQTAANIREATKLRGSYRLSPHGREGGPGVLDGIYVYAREHVK